MSVNKVVYGTTTLVDLTDLQTQSSNVLNGVTYEIKAQAMLLSKSII